MGLFGFKKADNKNSNVYINNDVINASDYANTPRNTIVGYNDVSQETPINEQNNATETYAYSDTNISEYPSEYTNQTSDVIMTINKDELIASQQQYQNQYNEETYPPINQSSEFVSGETEFNTNDTQYQEPQVTVETAYPQYEMPQVAYSQPEFTSNDMQYQEPQAILEAAYPIYNEYPNTYSQNEFGSGQVELNPEQQYYYDQQNAMEYNNQQQYNVNQYDYNRAPVANTSQPEFSTNDTPYQEPQATVETAYPQYEMPQVAYPQPEFTSNEMQYQEPQATVEAAYPIYNEYPNNYSQNEFGSGQVELNPEQQYYYDQQNAIEYNTQQQYNVNQYDYNTAPVANTSQPEYDTNYYPDNTQQYAALISESGQNNNADTPAIPEHTLDEITGRRTSNTDQTSSSEDAALAGDGTNANILEPITSGQEEFVSKKAFGDEFGSKEEKTALQQYYSDTDDFIYFDTEDGPDINAKNMFKLFIDVLRKPFTTLNENTRKYTKTSNSLLLTMWITLFSIGLCLAGRIIAGIITPTINPISGARKITIGFTNLLDVSNYLPYLIGILLFGLGSIIIVALVYYIASFIFSKGVHFGIYLATSALSMVPLIVSFTVAYPIFNILSNKLAIAVFIFGITFSLILFISIINETLKFKTRDLGTVYNAINVTTIILVAIYVLTTLEKQRVFDIFKLLR